MMQAIRDFLVSKGCPVDSWDDDQCKSVAKTLGFTAPLARVEAYTPQKKGVGMYLIIAPPKARDFYLRLNDGEALDDTGKATLADMANAIADCLE